MSTLFLSFCQVTIQVKVQQTPLMLRAPKLKPFDSILDLKCPTLTGMRASPAWRLLGLLLLMRRPGATGEPSRSLLGKSGARPLSQHKVTCPCCCIASALPADHKMEKHEHIELYANKVGCP